MRLEKKNDIGIIAFDRPESLNVATSGFLGELRDVLRNVENDGQIRAVIITGDKHFCAGADIREMKGKNREEAMAFSRLGHSVCDAIEGMGKPVIAAVRGYALGAGCEIAISCDLRIASEGAKIGEPEINLGIIPGFGGTQRLPLMVGMGKAKEMVLTGKIIDSKEAESIGLFNLVVKDESLLEKAEEIAAILAGKGPVALKYAKKLMTEERKTGKEMEVELFSYCFQTEDQKEGMNAFLEKRKAEYKGR